MERSRSVISRSVVAGIVLLGVLGVGSSGHSAADPEPEPLLSAVFEAAPSILGDLDVRLFADTADVTDQHCTALGANEFSTARGRLCFDLPDATYRLVITGAPAAAGLSWECSDLVASAVDPTDIVIARDSEGRLPLAMGCFGRVSLPGVLLAPQPVFVDPDLDPALIVDSTFGGPVALIDASGSVVSDDCEVDVTDDRQRFWCLGLPAGTYTAVGTDVPDGYRSRVQCETAIPARGGIVQSGRFTIDDTNLLWRCASPDVFVPLTISIDSSEDLGGDSTWVDDVTFVLRDEDGTDVSDRCGLSERFVVQDDFRVTSYACVALSGGVYSVEFAGVPDDPDLVSTCDPVVVPDDVIDEAVDPRAVCSLGVAVPAQSDYPPRERPIDEPVDDDGASEPTDELPTTGSSSWPLTWVAGVLLALGGLMLAVGRHRSVVLDV